MGSSSEEVWNSYQNEKSFFSKQLFSEKEFWVSSLSETIEKEVVTLKKSDSRYAHLDRTVLLAILASRKAMVKNNVSSTTMGINLGSSRGATGLFENYYQEFLSSGAVPTRTSPTTTLGNISSWVGQDLQSQGPVLSHSITCATALHAVLNGVAWLRSGMANTFLVGGSEAPLTNFTLAQMEVLKLYSKQETDFPCESMNWNKKSNTMILGEAAAVCILEKGIGKESKAEVKGLGYATEPLSHSISITPDAVCFQKSMKMALEDAQLKSVDVVVMHAPGTVKGDLAELNAIENLLDLNGVFLTSNKWKLGHTFGASGAMSLEMAVLMLEHQELIHNPFYANKNAPKTIENILINAVGFGGNAVSIIVSKP